MSLAVLFEDNHLLAVDKPAGLPVQPDASGDPSLIDLVREYRRERERKPGNVFVGLLHRLDRPVSGVVLIAKTSKAASRVSEQFRQRTIRKRYLALCHLSRDARPGSNGVWTDELIKDRRTNVVRPREQSPADEEVDTEEEASNRPTESSNRSAETRWRVLARDESARIAALELVPVTGRSHQLRVHAASHGLVIIGDVKYGSAVRARGRLKLHAAELTVLHPVHHDPRTFTAPLPAWWGDERRLFAGH